MEVLILVTRILSIIIGFSLAYLDISSFLKNRQRERAWLRLLGGFGGLGVGCICLTFLFEWVHSSPTLLNPLIVFITSILLSDAIYSRKTRGI